MSKTSRSLGSRGVRPSETNESKGRPAEPWSIWPSHDWGCQQAEIHSKWHHLSSWNTFLLLLTFDHHAPGFLMFPGHETILASCKSVDPRLARRNVRVTVSPQVLVHGRFV